MLESSTLNVSSSVVLDSPSSSSRTVLGEGFSLFVPPKMCFSTGEATLPLSLLLFNHLELN